MATIELRLSSKVQKDTGRSEVMIRFFYSGHDLYSKSEVFINPGFFEYYIDRKKTSNPKVAIPKNKMTVRMETAIKNGWSIRNSGVIVTNNKQIETPDVRFHKTQAKKIDKLKEAIVRAYEEADKKDLTSSWLKEVIDRFNHPQKYETTLAKTESFYELVERYIQKRQLAESHARVYRVLSREVARYEGFVRKTQKDKKQFVWDINTVTREDIEDLTDYLRNEKSLSEQYPKLFKKLLENYPASVKKGNNKIEERGENTIIKMRQRLNSLFHFFNEEGLTKNHPFDGLKIGTAKVGTPIYISIAERNKIAETDLTAAWGQLDTEDKKAARMPLKTLIEQRDIFIFHCFVGCRVGDLLRLTENHITDGVLVYTPHKTKDEGEEGIQARVPLHPAALALVEKYRGVDSKGRLFPFISAQRYNDALKVIFKASGITRKVEVRNPLTGENELRPINEIASSHMARRTFIGNAYFKVQDPNLIGKMSGHVEGSLAFKRYRKIEDTTLKEVIDLLT